MDLSKINTRDSTQVTRAYLDSLLLETSYIDSCVPDLHTEIFGHTFESPIMIAAFSHLGNMHPGGMAEMARGAKLAGICNWAGMGPNEEFDDIMAQGAPTIKIVKPYADRKKVYDQLTYAASHGALAVGIDIDHSFGSTGHPDVVLGETMAPITRQELRDFVQAVDKPFIVKGVLGIRDAVACRKAGVKGVVISHHHGIMQYAVPPLMLLPKIRKELNDGAVKDTMIFVDCAIESGADVLKCLALGANGVCVGRACLDSFRKAGADGVAKYIEGMTDELRAFMARTGSYNCAYTTVWNGTTEQVIREPYIMR